MKNILILIAIALLQSCGEEKISQSADKNSKFTGWVESIIFTSKDTLQDIPPNSCHFIVEMSEDSASLSQWKSKYDKQKSKFWLIINSKDTLYRKKLRMWNDPVLNKRNDTLAIRLTIDNLISTSETTILNHAIIAYQADENQEQIFFSRQHSYKEFFNRAPKNSQAYLFFK